MNLLETVVDKLRKEFGEGVQPLEEFRGETKVNVDPSLIVPVCTFLHEDSDFSFNFLMALTCVDYWPQEPRFTVAYQLYSQKNNIILGLRAYLPGSDPGISTIESVYPNANWHEREVYDMFGITFEGHSDLRRILMPHDWEGHPQRKDYPLGYEEVQFSYNFDEIDQRKKYARE
ncbi:MAG: NADH-quinone oxidoreductase subunit C [Chloroflexi bacterium RBG_16_48_8]|nr:MAG: NADH-quinone oxidoreductase subunit C [Chloroflexi bacterium RBG_16_48_8]